MHKANYETVKAGLTQLERAANLAIRRGDDPAVRALTSAQMLSVAIKAEARLVRLIYQPDLLDDSQVRWVLAAPSRLDAWHRLTEVGFRRRFAARRRKSPLEEQLDHTASSRLLAITEVLDRDLRLIIESRNKLAHGQWSYGLTSDQGQPSQELTKFLRATNTLALRFYDSIAEDIANAIQDLLQPGVGFDQNFDKHFRRIQSSKSKLQKLDFKAHVAKLRARQPSALGAGPAAGTGHESRE